MRYSKIRSQDISNGPGIRVSVFMQGCTFNCKECFNPETHDFNGGEELTEKVMDDILTLCSKSFIKGLSILGGEPLHPKNIEGTTLLAKRFKASYPDKSLWIWTGFLYGDMKDKEIMKYVDVLVDGRFEADKKDLTLKYCGSKNQRVIDVQKSTSENKIHLYEE